MTAPTQSTGLGCDFCCTATAVASFDVRRPEFRRTFVGPDSEAIVAFQGGWKACLSCAPLVRARRWGRLVRRATDTYISAHPHVRGLREHLRSEMAATYLQLERELTGGETPVGAR